MMDDYLDALIRSTLPFGLGVAALFWLILFVANHLVVARARAANDAQSTVEMQGEAELRRASRPMFLLMQIALFAFVFVAGAALGGVAATFFIGGQLVAVAFSLGLNVQSLLAARVLAAGQGVEGVLALTQAYLWQQASQRMAGAALSSLLLGCMLAHAALFGGAFVLGATAAGFLRRARMTGVPGGGANAAGPSP